MKTTFLVIVLVTLCLLIDLINCQRRGGSNRRRGRPRQRPKPRRTGQEPETKRINCYSCYVDFGSQKFDGSHLCYNPKTNYTAADHDHLTVCPAYTKFCQVDITKVNGILKVIDKRCGGNFCRGFCLSRGYGVEFETCTYCCPGKLTEEDDEYDEDESQNYICPKGAI